MTREVQAPRPVLASAPTPLPVSATRPPAKPVTGYWRYSAEKRSRGLYWTAILTAVAFHALVLFAFNRPPKVIQRVIADDFIAVNIVMPDLKDLEEPEKNINPDDVPPDPGVPVPTLPDVPTHVDLSTAFVQEMDYNTLLPPPDLSAAKTITIPPNISRGSRLGEGMANLFNLADLDRIPEALVRVPPTVPSHLRRQALTAEVRVAFIVDTTGAVLNPIAVSSTNPEFENAAVMAIAKWKFRPGMKGGRRVNARMMQPVLFTVSETD